MAEIKKRDGGIELFRCLLMMLIILHHCCLFGNLSRSLSACFLYPLTIIGVDCFAAISGWYGINFTWKRFFRIWCTMIYYMVVVFGFGLLAYHFGYMDAPPSKRPPWWFAYSYLCLMLIAPLINAAIQAFAENPKALLKIWSFYAIAMVLASWPFSKFSLVNGSGWGSHTVNTLTFVYFSMGVLRLMMKRFQCEIKWRKWFCCALFFFLVLLPSVNYLVFEGVNSSQMFAQGLSFIGFHVEGLVGQSSFHCAVIFTGRLGYAAPLVWISAILAFMSFRNMEFPRWFERIVLFVSPSMFGVYLFHESAFGRRFYQIPMAYLTEHCPALPNAVNIIGCMLFTFTISFGVDLLRRGALAVIKRVASFFVR